MRRIAVLTSGGDAPGMNAAIRAVVRTGLERGWEILGACHGCAGLMLRGIEEGAQVVLHPTNQISDRSRVESR